MYSERISQIQLEAIEQASGKRFTRYDVGESWARSEAVSKAYQKTGDDIGQWQLRRALKREEQAFILNETVLSKVDFLYWAPRYATIIRDGVEGGGLGKLNLWESQQVLMRLIAKAEEEEYAKWKRGDSSDGILIADHKSRQVGHTMQCRAILNHRMCFYQHVRATSASVDDEKRHELYDRDMLLLKHLPPWMATTLAFNVKDEHIQLDTTGSFQLYQQSTKQSSLGQGRQFDVAHLTELSEYVNPLAVEVDFFPTLPQSWKTLAVLESRANGRSGLGRWWMLFSESVRKGRKPRWRYCFIPWYAERKKYRRTPPIDWTSSEVSLMHAQKVEETSAEFMGYQYTLSRDQLYWWETTRAEYQESNTLNLFLMNYAATPAESYQSTSQSAYPAEFLEKARLSVSLGTPYEVQTAA